jgi:hypothetical protein
MIPALGGPRRREAEIPDVTGRGKLVGKKSDELVLHGRLTFTPRVDGQRHFYQFNGEGTILPILEGIVDDSITRCGVPIADAEWFSHYRAVT